MSKLHELNKSATIAWSPLAKSSSLIAAGTVAGILDRDFDTSAHLELFKIDLRSPKTEAKLVGSTTAADRFSKICWSSFGSQGSYPNGIIAGGLANGVVQIWDPAKIM